MALPLPLLLSSATAGMQLVGGAGKLLRRRPEYDIPESARMALGMASAQSVDPFMAGYEQAQGNINLATSNAIMASQMRGDGAVGLQSIAGQAQAANRDLSAQNEMADFRADQAYQAALGVMSQYENLEYQVNEFAPYADAQQEGRDMIGAGLENLMLTAQGLDLAGISLFEEDKEGEEEEEED
jgi:hypothetical protein